MSNLSPNPNSRSALTRQLAQNAATKPANVLAGAGTAVVGLLLYALTASGVGLALLPLAVVVYVALTVMTFFDTGEAERIAAANRQHGQARRAAKTQQEMAALDPRIQRLMDAALREEELLRGAIADSDGTMAGLSAEVDSLVAALRTIAGRTQKIASYLETQDRTATRKRLAQLNAVSVLSSGDQQLREALTDQVSTWERMDRQLSAFESEMEHATAVLSTMRGQLIQMSVDSDSLGEQRLTEQVRELREHVGTAADTMAEVARAV
jgi:hypothetical protein